MEPSNGKTERKLGKPIFSPRLGLKRAFGHTSALPDGNGDSGQQGWFHTREDSGQIKFSKSFISVTVAARFFPHSEAAGRQINVKMLIMIALRLLHSSFKLLK